MTEHSIYAFSEATARAFPVSTDHWTLRIKLEADRERIYALIEGVAKLLYPDSCFTAERFSNQEIGKCILYFAQIHQESQEKPSALDEILEAGIPIDVCDPENRTTALGRMSLERKIPVDSCRKIILALLSKGADVNHCDSYGEPMFYWALKARIPLEILILFQNRDTDMNCPLISHSEENALTIAVRFALLHLSDRDMEVVKFVASHASTHWGNDCNGGTVGLIDDRLASLDPEDAQKIEYLQQLRRIIVEPLEAWRTAQKPDLCSHLVVC